MINLAKKCHSLQSTVLLSLSQRKQITKAIEMEEENPGKQMPQTRVGWCATLSPSQPPDHQSRKTLLLNILCSNIQADSPTYSALAQNSWAVCPLDIPYLLRGQGTTLLLVVPTTPCHTLTGLPWGKEGAGIQSHREATVTLWKPLPASSARLTQVARSLH